MEATGSYTMVTIYQATKFATRRLKSLFPILRKSQFSSRQNSLIVDKHKETAFQFVTAKQKKKTPKLTMLIT